MPGRTLPCSHPSTRARGMSALLAVAVCLALVRPIAPNNLGFATAPTLRQLQPRRAAGIRTAQGVQRESSLLTAYWSKSTVSS